MRANSRSEVGTTGRHISNGICWRCQLCGRACQHDARQPRAALGELGHINVRVDAANPLRAPMLNGDADFVSPRFELQLREGVVSEAVRPRLCLDVHGLPQRCDVPALVVERPGEDLHALDLARVEPSRLARIRRLAHAHRDDDVCLRPVRIGERHGGDGNLEPRLRQQVLHGIGQCRRRAVRGAEGRASTGDP